MNDDMKSESKRPSRLNGQTIALLGVAATLLTAIIAVGVMTQAGLANLQAGFHLEIGELRKDIRNMDARLRAVEVNLAVLDARLVAVEGRLTKVEGRLTAVEGRLTAVETELPNLRLAIAGPQAQLAGESMAAAQDE